MRTTTAKLGVHLGIVDLGVDLVTSNRIGTSDRSMIAGIRPETTTHTMSGANVRTGMTVLPDLGAMIVTDEMIITGMIAPAGETTAGDEMTMVANQMEMTAQAIGINAVAGGGKKRGEEKMNDRRTLEQGAEAETGKRLPTVLRLEALLPWQLLLLLLRLRTMFQTGSKIWKGPSEEDLARCSEGERPGQRKRLCIRP